MGHMFSSAYETVIVEESSDQPLVDSTVKANTENIKNTADNLDTPENMHGGVKSGDEIPQGMRDFNINVYKELLKAQEEIPILFKSEEALDNPKMDSIKLKVQSLEKPEGDSTSTSEAEETLETPQEDFNTLNSKEAVENPMVDSSSAKVQSLEKPGGDSNSVKPEETLETQDFNTSKSKEALENPTVNLSCVEVQSLEKPREDSNTVKAEETLESPQGDSNTSKSEEGVDYPKVDSNNGKGQSFEKPEGDSDSVKSEEAPKKPEVGSKLQEQDEEYSFNLFMKLGGCKDSFVDWDICIQDADKSGENRDLDKCFDVTAALRKCMEAHIDYYRPVLGAVTVSEAVGTTYLEKEYDHKEYVQTKAAAYKKLKKEKGKEDVQASKKEDDKS